LKTSQLIEKYNFKEIDRQVAIIREAANKIKKLSGGIKAVDVNTDCILVYTYVLNQNVSDVLELES